MTIKNPHYARKKFISEIKKQIGPPTLGEMDIFISYLHRSRKALENESYAKLQRTISYGANPYAMQ